MSIGIVKLHTAEDKVQDTESTRAKESDNVQECTDLSRDNTQSLDRHQRKRVLPVSRPSARPRCKAS